MIKTAKWWERIEFANDPLDPKGSQAKEVFRLPVEGGWLISTGWGGNPGPLTFLPDANHAWDPTK